MEARMPRSVSDIEAEMDHLKSEGVHHLAAPMRSLREELYEADPSRRPAKKAKKAKRPKAARPVADVSDPAPEIVSLLDENDALRAEIRELKAQLDAPETYGADESVYCEMQAADAYDDPEWRFLEKCCGELELDLTRGVTTNMVKKIYMQVHAKVMAWRVIREIYGELGTGAKWPQWPALGRNPDTGEKDPKYDPERIKKEQEEKAAARAKQSPVAGLSEGGMPVRPGRPSPAEVLGQFGDVASLVQSEIGSRAVPSRERVGAPE